MWTMGVTSRTPNLDDEVEGVTSAGGEQRRCGRGPWQGYTLVRARQADGHEYQGGERVFPIGDERDYGRGVEAATQTTNLSQAQARAAALILWSQLRLFLCKSNINELFLRAKQNQKSRSEPWS